LQAVLEKNGKLIADTEVLVANIKEWLDKNVVQKAKPRVKAPDKDLLIRLRKNCESYDMDGIEDILSELEKNEYDENGDLIKWIREKVDISKMNEVIKRLEEV